jgi:hypothetical protein
MDEMSKFQTLLSSGLAGQAGNADLAAAETVFKKIMENVSVIKPNLSSPIDAGGHPGAAAEVCPSMADTTPGGKLFRDPENSSEERERSRKKVKARTDSVRAAWAETTDDATVETLTFGGAENGGAAAPLELEPTSPAQSDDEMGKDGDKTAKSPTAVPG